MYKVRSDILKIFRYFFAPPINYLYLLNQPYGAKVEKEKKTMTGAYRHYDSFHCSTFYMAVASVMCVENNRESLFNFYVDKRKGGACELILQIFSFSLCA